jgi:hypothetical protein
MNITDQTPPFSDAWLADRYLKYGSVEEAINSYDGHFPVSIADYHRKIKKFGVVKKVGRSKVSLAKTLYFFAQKAIEPTIPIEKLYKKMPLSFKESASVATVHRIYNNAMEKVVRLHAAGVIVTRSGDPSSILIVDELETSPGTGKVAGNSTILFSFAHNKESYNTSVLRVLQQELSVSATIKRELTVGGKLTKQIIPNDIAPFLHFHILDVEINVFHIELPADFDLNIFSSYKVGSHRFVHINNVVENKEVSYRIGVPEIINAYKRKVVAHGEKLEPQTITSSLNNALLTPALAEVNN